MSPSASNFNIWVYNRAVSEVNKTILKSLIFFVSVTWNTIDYNYCDWADSGFNGTVFTAPVDGIYSFYVTTRQDSVTSGHVYLYQIKEGQHHTVIAHGSRVDDQNRNGNIVVQVWVRNYLKTYSHVFVATAMLVTTSSTVTNIDVAHFHAWAK